ncbi:bifunctional phosphoribosylanthranilate isomerase/tryptophan synthase subunit beta [Kocuria sp. cx-116]|uniref:bifunctional phosphoribosylanthranilate isomerase/tryptophan synthase subunit beta n=1 Tax=Kocuria sp. cx-116 TaxID=2771378 RepID=UPI0016878E0F|nr:bifunctional phosphoribosylanthranilate isomerase/tryptophan synthase subunit beta [Kocuria sp. cx-116]MBD2761313.1 bifunctional phosphoribosylanthranilate isomerase/tryptophan synthase subunit beta [Kocuria sp. cx-116]
MTQQRTGTVLDQIIEGVREDLEARRAVVSLQQLQRTARAQAPALDAERALRGSEPSSVQVLSEVKRSSPSKGALADIADPAELAAAYERGGASAISVLTEKRRFGGSLTDLDAVRQAVSIPVLRKDFTVDEYQIWEARAHGADMVLLIVAALDDPTLRRFLDLTHELGMHALVETHTPEEIQRAVAVGARIIGVNTRNLKTLDVDVDTFGRLAEQIPADAVIIAESGVSGEDQIQLYAGHGANAVLTGEVLVTSDDPSRTIARFREVGAAARVDFLAGKKPPAAQAEFAAEQLADDAAAPASGGRSLKNAPGPYFGDFGGRWMPESLVAALDELTEVFDKARTDDEFAEEFQRLSRDYSGRPSLLTEAKRFGEAIGARVFLKREDLNHTGSHKINNVLGQALLAKRMGKNRLIAETGAGQHGVATATAAALFGMECCVYMGEEDTRRQALNVARMQLLGAEVVPVSHGSATLKDAINEALRDWVASVDTTHYLLGTAAGPHPFPAMVRYFHEQIGEEARAQILEQAGRLPDAVTACVGGGSNAIGIFHGFLDDPEVELYGNEAGGDGVGTGRHAATITLGRPGVLHGAKTFLMQDTDGQTIESHSISAGLDYPAVGPEHSHLHDIGRVKYEAITDTQAMDAFKLLSRTEGIIPAIESSHALAGARELAARWVQELGPETAAEKIIVVSLSGRGDKDVATAAEWFDLLPENSHEEQVGQKGEEL